MSSVLEPIAHPATPPAARIGLSVRLERHAGGWLDLRYRVDALAPGAEEALSLPSLCAGGRTDGLWRTSCFEMFAMEADGPAYREHNFAPSLAWAAYDFDAPRAGMRDAPMTEPALALLRRAGEAELAVRLRLPGDAPLRIGLSAVIEERDGTKSYWALAHPKAEPDFHDPACFAAELAAPSGS